MQDSRRASEELKRAFSAWVDTTDSRQDQLEQFSQSAMQEALFASGNFYRLNGTAQIIASVLSNNLFGVPINIANENGMMAGSEVIAPRTDEANPEAGNRAAPPPRQRLFSPMAQMLPPDANPEAGTSHGNRAPPPPRQRLFSPMTPMLPSVFSPIISTGNIGANGADKKMPEAKAAEKGAPVGKKWPKQTARKTTKGGGCYEEQEPETNTPLEQKAGLGQNNGIRAPAPPKRMFSPILSLPPPPSPPIFESSSSIVERRWRKGTPYFRCVATRAPHRPAGKGVCIPPPQLTSTPVCRPGFGMKSKLLAQATSNATMEKAAREMSSLASAQSSVEEKAVKIEADMCWCGKNGCQH